MKYGLSLALWFCLSVSDAEALPPPNLQAAQNWNAFVGDWQLVGEVGAAEEQVNAAIDKATESMSFLTRGLARSRLRSSQKPPKRIRLRLQNQMFTIQPDSLPALSLPISGAAVKDAGRTFRVALESGGGRLSLHQVSENQQGKRQNVYRLRDGGKSLELEVTVHSGNLPTQVQYKLQFVRVE
ncbi:MAG: hypothetical protein ACREEM_09280 [Blastocatellia bacterium]